MMLGFRTFRARRRLIAARAATYRTDLHGTVDVSTDGQHLWVRSER